MRRAGLVGAALVLAIAGPVSAQVVWDEFTDQSEFFTVNFPGKPNVQSTTYKTAKGTSLPAKVYTAKDARGGEYKITVVNYSTAKGEEARAQELLREAGVRGLVPKPFAINRLIEKVKECLPGVETLGGA